MFFIAIFHLNIVWIENLRVPRRVSQAVGSTLTQIGITVLIIRLRDYSMSSAQWHCPPNLNVITRKPMEYTTAQHTGNRMGQSG